MRHDPAAPLPAQGPQRTKKKAERELGRVQQGGEMAETTHVVHSGTSRVMK
jgi:hypothetical protein